jgi:GNAT superfamily N-acetyltransferase
MRPIGQTCYPRTMTLARPRNLSFADIPDAIALSSLAGWNQTTADWSLLLDLEPQHCWGIEVDGVLAATTTLVTYERRLAWIGMVLTHPEFRRRGLARRLVEHALQTASDLRIQTVKLDATEQGQPLYDSLGFRPEQAIERWSVESPVPKSTQSTFRIPAASPIDEAMLDLDAQTFGANRSCALQALANASTLFQSDDGYFLARPGREKYYLGPCVAKNAEPIQMMIQQALEKFPGTSWFWDLFPQNSQALALAQQLGFKKQRSLLRMVVGPNLPTRTGQIFAIAGFELG